MPLEVIESADSLADLIRLKSSSIYEMMISLRVVLEPPRSYRDWAESAAKHLPDDYMEEMATLYRPFRKGLAFLELPVDYEDKDDVEGFIDYVRNMSPSRFLFYLIGRVISLKQLEAQDNLTLQWLRTEVENYNEKYLHYCDNLPLTWVLDDPAAFQNRLADVWQFYWDNFFKVKVDEMTVHWEKAIEDRERLLRREGGQELLKDTLGRFEQLPPPLPVDMPYQEITVIPINLLPHHAYMFFGYGNVTVLFNSSMTAERRAEVEAAKEEALTILKSLSDGTRLNILRLISRSHGEIHGKKIAQILDMSPSVVSRHLSQLKDSGLIIEIPQDNRMIHYQLQDDMITSLPDKLLDYIHGA
jgi:DNA-binding transcriptional ArsR family regulator